MARVGAITRNGAGAAVVVDPARVPGTPWRNGGGTTRELCVGPPYGGSGAEPAGPAWRVSVAEIVGPASYSRFDGLQRWSAVVAGEGLDLAVDGVAQRVDRGPVVTYAGEADVRAVPVGGPVLNLNLMVDRAWGSGRMRRRIVEGAGRWDASVVALWVLAGEVRVDDARAVAGQVVLPRRAGWFGASGATLVEVAVAAAEQETDDMTHGSGGRR